MKQVPALFIIIITFIRGMTVYSQSSLFTLTDAEKILGESSHLTDSASENNTGVITYSCVFAADSKDKKTGKTGIVYFMIEEYPSTLEAKSVYESIKLSNKDHEGFKELNNLGDEAYFHSDEENFYYVMVRKGAKMFRMKVNKITDKTSLDEFNIAAIKITALM